MDEYKNYPVPYGWVMAMRNHPENPFWFSARRMYTMLLDPVNKNLSKITSLYLGLIGHFKAGAEWAERPYSTISCNRDLDHDGEKECILASEYSFATIELTGGYIATLFVRSADGIHQIVGPTYQLSGELSDPSIWKSNDGINADPNQILGAFFDSSDMSFYNYSYNDNALVLFKPASQTTKTYSLNSHGISFEYYGAGDLSFQIPLVIDPWIMERPGWGNLYFKEQSPASFLWGIHNRLIVEIVAKEQFEASTFIDSREVMRIPEDPNYAYPPGHYLPFPLAVTALQCNGSCSVDIVLHRP